MTKRDRQKLDVMQRLNRGELSRSQAARILTLSERQVYRLYRRWQSHGDGGLVHRSRGGHSGHRYDLSVRNRVLVLYRRQYSDYGPTLYGEVLSEQYGLRLHAETLRRWLVAAGLWPVTPGRRRRLHRRARPRRSAFGALLQVDGSPHDWFEGRNPALPAVTLLVAIDDATNRVVLRFAAGEDARGVFSLLAEYFRRYGVPQSIYTDHGSVYWEDGGTTQYQRAMTELGVETIFARSPQAKGRVERVNRTLQDRLVKAMRQRGITTIEEANGFLAEQYEQAHNDRFASDDRVEDVHRVVGEESIAHAMSMRDVRILRNDYTVLVATRRWQIERPIPGDQYLLPAPGARIEVRLYLDDSVHLFTDRDELRVSAVRELNSKQPFGRPPGPNGPAVRRKWRIRPIDEQAPSPAETT